MRYMQAIKQTMILGGALLLAAGAATAIAGEDANEIVGKVRKNYEGIKTLQVDFVQTIYWALAEEKQTFTGRLFLAGERKYRVESDAQTIVTDGTTLWTFSKNRNQLIINQLAQSKENPLPRDLLLQYTKDFRASYKGETEIGGTPCYVIEFSPRESESFITRTKIWVMKHSMLVARIEQEDINENITRYDLSNFSINPPLPNSLFSFQTPASAEVVDLR